MKPVKINTARWRYLTGLSFLIGLSLMSIRCQEEVIEWESKSNELVITEYVHSNPDLFYDFGEIIKLTGIENLLRVRGPFTLLLPTDSALQVYYDRMNVSSYLDIDVKVLETLVYNHLFEGEISAGSIGLGTLPYQNALGDFVASDFSGIDILLNKSAIIIKRDVQVANGYVHHIDNVLDPITESVFDVLSTYPGYSIFLDGLEIAGIADTLNVISFPYGDATARTFYTLLAVPDTLYNREGIFSVDDLIELYSTSGDLTNIDNGFYQYMEYHCLSGAHYFSDFEPNDNYYIISYENYLNIRVEDDFKVNKSATGYTGFYYELSNIPAKNGAIHTVNTLLPITETNPAAFTFQTTDFFDLQQGSYYLNNYQRFYDGENTFEFLKWDAEYLLYYLKPAHFLMDDDCLNLNGHFWVEITTPKIRKWKYRLSGFFFQGGTGWAIMACYVDGNYIGQVNPNDGDWGGSPIVFGDVDFTESTTHTIRLVSIVPGNVFWDYVRFTPI